VRTTSLIVYDQAKRGSDPQFFTDTYAIVWAAKMLFR